MEVRENVETLPSRETAKRAQDERLRQRGKEQLREEPEQPEPTYVEPTEPGYSEYAHVHRRIR